MNVRLLRRVAKHILAEPRRYEQGVWCEATTSSPCGTTACIAGWAAILGEKLDLKTIDHDDLYYRASSKARKLLNINRDQAARLFSYPATSIEPDELGWPKRFAKRFFAAKTKRGQAKVAVARIEHFIKTKGAE
jgi:hypothetical protein